MASTATLDTFSASVDTLKVEYIDANGNIRTPTYLIKPGIDQAGVAALVDLVDPNTHCRVCEVMVNSRDYIIGGSVADSAAHWFEVYQEVVLSFRSLSRCKKTVSVIIPGPVDGIFTGTEGILINPTAATLVPLIAWFELNLQSKDYGGLNDFRFTGGERRQVALPTPNVH